jgi:hypothetical protein
MTLPDEQAPANYVPAAAVIRRVQALSGIIGRKEMRRRSVKFLVKSPGSTRELPRILTDFEGIRGCWNSWCSSKMR